MPIPDGFTESNLRMAYSDLIGPIYCHHNKTEERLGLRVEARHCNRGRMAHGGLLMSLSDIAMGKCGLEAHNPRRGCLTVNMSYDFLMNAPLNSWLETRTKIERAGKTLAFLT
jgi:acyl-coenzyme A thioesterase 13